MFFAGIVLLVFFLKRLLAWMDERGWVTCTENVPTYHTLGNAFLELLEPRPAGEAVRHRNKGTAGTVARRG